MASGAGVGTPSSTTAMLDALGRRYAGGMRAVVGSSAAVIAPFTGPPGGVVLAIAISVAFILWTGVHLRLMLRGTPRWYWVPDIGVVIALCALQRWLVDPVDQINFLGWITIVASFTAATAQWHLPTKTGAVVALIITIAYVGGAAWSPEVTLGQAVAPGGAWMLVEASLSRLLWALVGRGGRIADRRLERDFLAERAASLAAARRRAQREHWAIVHDTSATTLLMIGLGEVRGEEPWLREQIRGDIDAMRGAASPVDGEVDLADKLAETVARARVEATFECPVQVSVPGHVAVALAGAAGEALENVRRHAGVDRARVVLQATEVSVSVTVVDSGCGFDPQTVNRTRRGLRGSVVERMREAGGWASVVSVPGAGTRIRLEWRHG